MSRLRLLVAVSAVLNPGVRVRQAAGDEVVIPFTLTDQNNIVVKAKINGVDELKLMLHTAATEVTLTEDATKRTKSVRFSGAHRVQAWGGESDSRFSTGNAVEIGGLLRKGITIREDTNSGKGTDGKFGLDFFPKNIVEVDFDRRRLSIHHRLPRKAAEYTRLKVEKKNSQIFVEGTCMIEGRPHPHRFLVHSGYSGGVLLDDAFAKSSGVGGKIRITEETSLKDSFGRTIKVRKGVLPAFELGNLRISNAPVGFFAGAIGNQKMSIVGCDVLQRFNILFDVAGNGMYVSLRTM